VECLVLSLEKRNSLNTNSTTRLIFNKVGIYITCLWKAHCVMSSSSPRGQSTFRSHRRDISMHCTNFFLGVGHAHLPTGHSIMKRELMIILSMSLCSSLLTQAVSWVLTELIPGKVSTHSPYSCLPVRLSH